MILSRTYHKTNGGFNYAKPPFNGTYYFNHSLTSRASVNEWPLRLPDAYTLFCRTVHAVARLHTKGIVKLRHIAQRTDCTEIAR